MKLSPSLLPVFAALPVVTADCAVYTVKDGDTCASIGRANNATYAQLLARNSEIDTRCSNLGDIIGSELGVSNPLGDYAIPTNTIGSPDIMTTIAYGSLPRSVSKNPQVWENCTNLMRDYYYCVKPVGYITTYPGYGSSATTDPFEPIPCTPLPDPGPGNRDPFANYPSTFPVIPLANGTRRDCYHYVWFDNITDNAAADYWGLAMVADISPEEITPRRRLWNPSLSENSTSVGPPRTITLVDDEIATAYSNAYAYPCTLSATSSYCIRVASPTSTTVKPLRTPSPRANGEVANCTAWHRLKAEWATCQLFLDGVHLSIEQFYAMNPSVKDDCSGFVLGTYYCLSTYPGGAPRGQPAYDGPPTTTATATTPPPFHNGGYDPHANPDRDGQELRRDNDISLDEFNRWNPAAGKDDCSGLQADVYVCVGVDDSTTNTTPAPMSTSVVVAIPKPT
ncbi:LysM peptidoglycan-binding domain-containing protein [Aspergillus lucknowensis]|uniref:LysM domain-containing protein n=1 Tax=Aspergillus lucknowensis TaxID=176173 RepID=A0ABR4LTF1_9EURO